MAKEKLKHFKIIFPEKLHRELKVICAKEQISMNEKIIEIITKEIN